MSTKDPRCFLEKAKYFYEVSSMCGPTGCNPYRPICCPVVNPCFLKGNIVLEKGPKTSCNPCFH